MRAERGADGAKELIIEPIDDADEIDATEKKEDTNLSEIPKGEGQETADETQSQAEKLAEGGNELYETFLKNEIGVPNPYMFQSERANVYFGNI